MFVYLLLHARSGFRKHTFDEIHGFYLLNFDTLARAVGFDYKRHISQLGAPCTVRAIVLRNGPTRPSET